ncbi:PadR family transcriptional regulator [Sinomonas sp. JGH33]|uniref:PadR family transcriptional regulator n=1 Tax=Sinomonas terricola TaxID=3110330 RepID=A0ABU5T792_9MICC|nr:PadR family transcriptional regulator [Sinomonas sp. JGH33]MEA5455566.1 PadR family transcriptional regulator [Sinomonas sp. JGH33]
MAKRSVSNPLALAVLACVWERPMYPYEITTTLRERGKQDSIRLNFGSLYAVIRSLESHGFVRAARTEREGNRPERIVYEITQAGMTEALDWMRDLISRPVKEYPDFEAGLSLLPMLSPDEAKACLAQRLERLDAEITARSEMEQTGERGLPELFLIESSYRRAMLEAERAFVASLLERINRKTFGGIDIWEGLHAALAAGTSREEIAAQLAARLGEEESTPHHA